MNKDTLASVLRVLTLGLSLAAVLTLVPFAGASKPNIMGYRSLCTFTPVSTALLLFVAYSLNGYRDKIKNREHTDS